MYVPKCQNTCIKYIHIIYLNIERDRERQRQRTCLTILTPYAELLRKEQIVHFPQL